MNKTFVKPLTYGRMGNFLFQAACAMAYAWKHGLEYTLPNSTNDATWNPIYLQHLVRPEFNDNLGHVVITEKKFNFQDIPFKEEWRGAKNIILDGYWQSERYFSEYREQILKAFGYQWFSLPRVVSVHVRRGDYLTIMKAGRLKHPAVPKEWIEEAMALFPNHIYRFYSDDIAWCREAFGNRFDCGFSDGKSEEYDLIDMSTCEHHICSASTFSWWGAWLNRNPYKRVIMPKHWLSPGWGGLDTRDVVPPEWERI
jgi:hypothetical protein